MVQLHPPVIGCDTLANKELLTQTEGSRSDSERSVDMKLQSFYSVAVDGDKMVNSLAWLDPLSF